MAGIVLLIFLLAIAAILTGHFRLVKQYKEELEEERSQRIKMTEFYDILIRWIELYQENESISKWLTKRGYKRIAVYGMRELGILLYRELVCSELDLCCAIDRNADNLNLNQDIKVWKPTNDLPDLDVIIVSAPHYYEQIRNDLENITRADIVSIEDIIFEM